MIYRCIFAVFMNALSLNDNGFLNTNDKEKCLLERGVGKYLDWDTLCYYSALVNVCPPANVRAVF